MRAHARDGVDTTTTTRKKGIPEVLVRSVMCLYEGAKTRVGVDSELLEEFEVKVWMHQRSVLLYFCFVVGDVNKLAKNDLLNELLYADVSVMISEGLRNKSL